MAQIMAETKKGSYERCIQVSRTLERKQFIRDGSLNDSFQQLKPKQKGKKYQKKDRAMLALIRRYDASELTREEYGHELSKTMPQSENTSL